MLLYDDAITLVSLAAWAGLTHLPQELVPFQSNSPYQMQPSILSIVVLSNIVGGHGIVYLRP
jgi:hypothetical protein